MLDDFVMPTTIIPTLDATTVTKTDLDCADGDDTDSGRANGNETDLGDGVHTLNRNSSDLCFDAPTLRRNDGYDSNFPTCENTNLGSSGDQDHTYFICT